METPTVQALPQSYGVRIDEEEQKPQTIDNNKPYNTEKKDKVNRTYLYIYNIAMLILAVISLSTAGFICPICIHHYPLLCSSITANYLLSSFPICKHTAAATSQILALKSDILSIVASWEILPIADIAYVAVANGTTCPPGQIHLFQ